MVWAVRTARARLSPLAGVAVRFPHPNTSETTRTMPTCLFIELFGRDLENFVQSPTCQAPAIGARHPAMYHPKRAPDRDHWPTVTDALMTDQKPRSCLRCGTALVAGLSFCPRCGLNNDEAGDRADPPVDGQEQAPGRSRAGSDGLQAPLATATQPVGAALSALPRSLERGLGGNAKLWSAVIVVAALVIFDLLTRPQVGGAPGAAPGGGVLPDASAAAPSALIVGLTIESPRDGQVVATKDITVIGIAPPGLTIRSTARATGRSASASTTARTSSNSGSVTTIPPSGRSG